MHSYELMNRLARLPGRCVPVKLIKPQFAVGKGQVGKGGSVRDEAARGEAVESIRVFVQERGFEVKGVIPSFITGQDGNVEYLIHAISLRTHVSPVHT